MTSNDLKKMIEFEDAVAKEDGNWVITNHPDKEKNDKLTREFIRKEKEKRLVRH